MPVTRFGGTEEEKLIGIARPQLELLRAINTNRAISDAIMTDITKRYGNTDLSDRLGNTKGIHVSFSWG